MSGSAGAGRVVVALLGAASCGGGGLKTPTAVSFQEVPEASGLAFRHEIPGGELDDIVKSAMGGLALLDYDGDGRVDVFIPNGGWDEALAHGAARPEKLPTAHLFRNLGGMKFEDVTAKAGVGFDGPALGACVGDYDGDGRADLFVCGYGRPALYRNRGDGAFEDATQRAGLAPGLYAGATFLDYDRDGVLDLFASQYVDLRDAEESSYVANSFPPPAAYPGRPARLWRGRGDGTFEDVTARAGVGKPGKGMGVLATDVDADGWIDVLVANDSMENFLWRNQGDGTFADAAGRLNLALGLEGDPRASMGVTAADLDADGRLDYLVPDTRAGAIYVAAANFFRDRVRDWGFARSSEGVTGWTDVALDVENDGLTDVWLVHGDVRRLYETQQPILSLNVGRDERGAQRFVEAIDVPGGAPPLELVLGRGAVAADFDDDGREDLFVVSLNGAARLYRNLTAPAGAWVRVRLAGRGANTMALGARLTGRVGKLQVVREVSSSTGYVSAGDVRLFIGLGDATSLDDVVVRWPDGRVQRVGSLAAGGDRLVKEE